jgi:hypothetical protein
MVRFPMQAERFEEAAGYLRERARQAVIDGWKAASVAERLSSDGVEWGARTFLYSPDGELHQSIYVYAQHRKRGIVAEHLLATRDVPIATTPDNDLETYLERHRVRYAVVAKVIETLEYRMIAAFWGDRRARRTGLYYMNHIDEGLAALRAIGASDRAMRAFCLHPIVHSDEGLEAAYRALPLVTEDAQVLALALELRHAAARSKRHPLPEVDQLLVACTLQRFKDASRHGRNVDGLRATLHRLGVDEAERARLIAIMDPFAR